MGDSLSSRESTRKTKTLGNIGKKLRNKHGESSALADSSFVPVARWLLANIYPPHSTPLHSRTCLLAAPHLHRPAYICNGNPTSSSSPCDGRGAIKGLGSFARSPTPSSSPLLPPTSSVSYPCLMHKSKAPACPTLPPRPELASCTSRKPLHSLLPESKPLALLPRAEVDKASHAATTIPPYTPETPHKTNNNNKYHGTSAPSALTEQSPSGPHAATAVGTGQGSRRHYPCHRGAKTNPRLFSRAD